MIETISEYISDTHNDNIKIPRAIIANWATFMQKEMIIPTSILPGYIPADTVNSEKRKAMQEEREYIYTPPVWDSATPPPNVMLIPVTIPQPSIPNSNDVVAIPTLVELSDKKIVPTPIDET